jgi:hypothetical protein
MCYIGSASRVNTRTLLKLSVFATLRSAYKRSSSAPSFEFGEGRTGITPSRFVAEPAKHKRYQRDPVVLAEKWQQRLLDGKATSRADLARELGVSRARVTQVLGLLRLTPEIITKVRSLGDYLAQTVVSEKSLRRLVLLPPEDQWRAISEIVGEDFGNDVR